MSISGLFQDIVKSKNEKKNPSCLLLVTLPNIPEATISSTTSVSSAVPDLDMVEDSELIGDDLDSLLDQEQTEVKAVFVVFVLVDQLSNSSF